MREHLGDEVATIDGDPWTAERHNNEVPARPQGGDVFRHTINFDLELTDLEAAYDSAGEIAQELGLTENINNSDGIGPYGRIYYGAGQEEGRVFILSGESSEVGGATYQTRGTDHESVIAADRRVLEKRAREREQESGVDDPPRVEDIEDYADQ